MPNAHRAVPSVSLVVSWPGSVPEPCAAQLADRLAQAKISSTWAVEEPVQGASLTLRSPHTAEAELALMVGKTANVAEAVDRGLAKFERAGQDIVAVQLDSSVCRGNIERRLRQSGISAVISATKRGESPIVRPLPFGVWEFGAQVCAPAPRRLLPIFGRRSATLCSTQSPVVASIDMRRLAGANARDWNSVDRLIDQAAEISALGTTRIMTIAEVAAEMSQAAVTRPQRSILRAAA